MNAIDRFWTDVSFRPGSCWLWNGKTTLGYGYFCAEGRMFYAHRFAWEQENGAIPKGLDIDHLCRTRDCVNPAHMEPVTRRENVLRGNSRNALNAAKTLCDKGHPLSGDNLYTYPSGNRGCRDCRRRLRRETYERQRS